MRLTFFVLFIYIYITKHKRLEAGYEPTKRPTRHTGDVLAPDPHAVKGNPHGAKPNKAIAVEWLQNS